MQFLCLSNCHLWVFKNNSTTNMGTNYMISQQAASNKVHKLQFYNLKYNSELFLCQVICYVYTQHWCSLWVRCLFHARMSHRSVLSNLRNKSLWKWSSTRSSQCPTKTFKRPSESLKNNHKNFWILGSKIYRHEKWHIQRDVSTLRMRFSQGSSVQATCRD